MSSRKTMAKGSALADEQRPQTQQGSGTLWSSQGEMKRYVAKLKSELDEQKSRVKRVHRDKAEEIKRLQENLDNERQIAIENVAKKLETDKVYEMKKLREAVVKQKESELRQVLRLKDEEMRALKQEVQECKNSTRIMELENKRVLNERLREDVNDVERRLRSEVTALRHEKRRLEESLRIKTEADNEKVEDMRKMRYEHDVEVQRLTRESKRESFKEFRHLKAVSKEVEVKNHQLAAKELEMRRLEEERIALGNKLNMQRKKVTPDVNSSKNDSLNSQKPKGFSVSQSHISESDFENVAEDRIKKLKMRNSELVAIARKLEEKAKRLQEERDILEKSSSLSPEVGNLKKAFARQRAKDLAEHAKLLMNRDSEIDDLRKEVHQGSYNGFIHNENDNELEKIVQQTAKERLLLEKQLSFKEEVLAEEIRSKSLKLTNDNEMLKEELCKLQDVEAKHFGTIFEMNQIRKERDTLQHASSEKEKRIYKLELEKQTFVAKNNALQKKNSELLHKVDQLGKVEKECTTLKENLQTLKYDHEILKEENNKLRAQVQNLVALKKEMERLQQDNVGLQKEKEDSVLKLEEREKEIIRLHQAQDEAQTKHDEQVSELDEMVQRLKEQSDLALNDELVVSGKPSVGLPVLSSTPNNVKFTQTSRPSSPTLSPIIDNQSGNGQQADELNHLPEAANEGQVQDSLCVPGYATSSSTSFDLEQAATRIEQLAASDSDGNDFHSQQTPDSPSVSSDLSDDTEEEVSDNSVSEDISYSADVSRTSDVEEPHRTNENNREEVRNSDDEDGNDFIGNQLHEVLDVEEKLSIFIAKYSYDPLLYSPNDNPESELAFQAGDYLYIFGDVGEDGFFVGELMNGERGLVPSNFIERIAEEDEAILKESDRDDDDDSEDDSSEEEITLKDEDDERKVVRPKAFSERRHEMFRTSLDYMLNDQLGDIRESEEEDLGTTSENDLDVKTNVQKRNNKASANFADDLDSMDSDVPPPRVPSPTKLSLDRQFTNSALISWRGSTLSSDDIQGYNIYVDGKLKTQTQGSQKTNALVEDVNPEETYRLSVRTRSVSGSESRDVESTMVFGPDAKLSPYGLRTLQITQTSAEIQWLPANSSYAHEVFLDDSLLFSVKPAVSSHTFNELSPSTLYHVRVRTQIPNHLRLALGKAATEDNVSSEIEFTTSAGGMPEPPVDLRLEQQTTEKITLTWLPVTISPNGYSNGFKVNGYKVYVNDIYCTETDSASVDTLSITTERLRNLGKRQDMTRMRFVVRTLSVLGESVDSNVVEVLSTEENGSTGGLLPGAACLHSEGKETRTNSGLADQENDIGVINGDDQRLDEDVPNGLDPNTSTSDNSPTASISTLGPISLSSDTTSESAENSNFENRETEKEDSNSETVDPWTFEKPPTASSLETHGNNPVSTLGPTLSSVSTSDSGNINFEKREAEKEDSNSETVDPWTSEKPPTASSSETHGNNPVSTLGPTLSSVSTSDSGNINFEKREAEKEDSKSETRDRLSTSDSMKPTSEASLDQQHNKPSSVPGLCSSENSEGISNVTERGTGTGGESLEGRDVLPPDGRRPPVVVHYDVDDDDDETETESCTADSKTETEEESVEIFGKPKMTKEELESEGGGDPVQANDLQPSTVTDDDEKAPSTSVGSKRASESETDTDFGDLLSVIDEVDEENLSEPKNDASPGGDESISNNTVSNSQESSVLSGSKTRTLSSEDEGFRTDDDVLDLLDDVDDYFGKHPVEKHSKAVESTRNNTTTPLGEVAVTDHDKNTDSEQTNSSVSQPEETRTKIGNKLRNSEAMSSVENQEHPSDSSETLEKLNVAVNENTTGEESTENISESSFPTRTSLNSDSSSTLSDAPILPDETYDAIHKTLSLPGNREQTSGNSDMNDNVHLGVTGLDGKPDLNSDDSRMQSETSEKSSELVRYFVGLYNYDPSSMSPNPDGAEEELPFNEGDLIKVFGDQDDDGFFWGECKRRQGYVPSNMVSVVALDEAEDMFNEATNSAELNLEVVNNFTDAQTNSHSELDVDVVSEDYISSDDAGLAVWKTLGNEKLGPRKMRALFDYDPVRDSPNVDSEVELMFKTGAIIYVFGDMDDDGFYQGELQGIRGLVPSNFLEPVKVTEFDTDDNLLPRTQATSRPNASTSQKYAVISPGLTNGSPNEQEQQQKKKKGIFSKGKKMFKKAFR